jgi:nucleotide-binding universal stress UspA family protein
MSIRKIELPMFGSHNIDHLLASACGLAKNFGAELDICFIRFPANDAAMYGAGYGFVSTDLAEQIEQEGEKAASDAERRYQKWCESNKGHPTIHWSSQEGRASRIIAQRGCLSDLILLPRPAAIEGSIDESFEAAVFGAGKLALVMDADLPQTLLDHVLIAWNGSPEAAHAVAQALPFLAKAGKVSIFSTGESDGEAVDADGLVRYLELHGVFARRATEMPAGLPVHKALEQVIACDHVSLVVMGAYTHSRVRQMLFGGVTQHMLSNSKTPVLFAH